jgi:hypothetical protein
MTMLFNCSKIPKNTSVAAVMLASAAAAAAAAAAAFYLSTIPANINHAINKGAQRVSNILSSSTTSATATTPTFHKRTCHMCQLPILRPKCHMHYTITIKQPLYFHLHCFVCLHCNSPIEPKSQLYCCVKLLGSDKWTAATSTNREHGAVEDFNNNNEKVRPFHQECFAYHFGYICVVCEKPLPIETTLTNDNHHANDDNTRAKQNIIGWTTMAMKCTQRVFFDTERICPHHKKNHLS